MSGPTHRVRHLIVVLGDQLDAHAAAFDGFEPARDLVWMCEARDEAQRTWSSKQRIAVFLAAMRHFAQHLRAEGLAVDYHTFAPGSLADGLAQAIATHRPEQVILTEPGEWDVLQGLRHVCADAKTALEIRADRHFLCSNAEFARFARNRRQLRLEYFYREMRRRHGVLMVPDAAEPEGLGPAGGQWNFDADNRAPFEPSGPASMPARSRFEPDAITREVLDLVERQCADHPGSLEDFAWPLTAEQARHTLEDFITDRLPHFGRWQDAMWTGEAWLYHSHLSVALNLKLLDPRTVIAAAEQAWRAGRAPLAAVEGFIRQVLGWREYVRGLYWLKMPAYRTMNALQAHVPLPDWYWNGQTDFACLRETIGQSLRLGYAHHIQRLMVTGLFALLYGAEPEQVHRWYLSVYVDAVEWVELPNTLGMSQYADGGLMASKPYAASGKYIERMSNYCKKCRYRPAQRTGETACPFTTLYWAFLLRHETRFAGHPRMALQVKNLARIDAQERAAIEARAQAIQQGKLGPASVCATPGAHRLT